MDLGTMTSKTTPANPSPDKSKAIVGSVGAPDTATTKTVEGKPNPEKSKAIVGGIDTAKYENIDPQATLNSSYLH